MLLLCLLFVNPHAIVWKYTIKSKLANNDDTWAKKQKVITLKVTSTLNLSELVEEIAHCGNADFALSVHFLTSVRTVVMMKGIRMS